MKQEQTGIRRWQSMTTLCVIVLRWSVLVGLLIFVLMGATSCQKNKIAANVDNTEFNVQTFKQILQTQLMGGGSQPRGYSIVINKGGMLVDSVSFGWAYMSAAGGGYVSMNAKQEINIASVSKTITAIGVLQLMKANDLTPQSKIGQWLPAYWNAKQAIKDITFEQLLTHSSGLLESNTSWDSLKATVKRGLDDPAKPADAYANINFALFRAMIPYLRDKNAAVTQENSMVPGNISGFENWLSLEYIEYMQDKVFDAIGIGEATCKASMNTALAFNENNNNNNVASVVSANPGDWTNSCGGGGYYLSAIEMARFMAFLSHSYTMLDKDQRSMMDNKLYGWDDEDSPMTIKGPSYGKDGALYWDANNNNSPDLGEAGLQTLIMKFPAGIELSLVVNSIPGNWRSLSSMARTAYNNAWE